MIQKFTEASKIFFPHLLEVGKQFQLKICVQLFYIGM